LKPILGAVLGAVCFEFGGAARCPIFPSRVLSNGWCSSTDPRSEANVRIVYGFPVIAACFTYMSNSDLGVAAPGLLSADLTRSMRFVANGMCVRVCVCVCVCV